MIVNNKHYESIWWHESSPEIVYIIDQSLLPFKFAVKELKNVQDVFIAIKNMYLRGAPLIGAAAAWGMYMAVLNSSADNHETSIYEAADLLKTSRPTAVNLAYAVNLSLKEIASHISYADKLKAALDFAIQFTNDEKEASRMIGQNGLSLIEEIKAKERRGR